MTRKHIEAIAAALKSARIKEVGELSGAYNVGVNFSANRIANALEGLNPSFDRARFLTDCGVTS